jgi:hypothetical protein
MPLLLTISGFGSLARLLMPPTRGALCIGPDTGTNLPPGITALSSTAAWDMIRQQRGKSGGQAYF